MKTLRLGLPVMLVYWLMLLGGLGLYTAIRVHDAASLTPLWIGAVTGTVLGHFLALRSFKFWIAAFISLVISWSIVSVTPPEFASKTLWMSFVPAALCAFWSLSDRASLAAFWFPAVIWMLSILDRADGITTPDRSGIVLLGGLAVVFIVFLRVRETRRVALWRTIASAPLAHETSNVVLKEAPGSQIARAGWTLLVSSIAFAIVAWLAPQLWQAESFDGEDVQIAEGPDTGVPCCPISDAAPTKRSRVKEYLDLGRGHDETGPVYDRRGCRVCDGLGLGVASNYEPIPYTPDPGPYYPTTGPDSETVYTYTDSGVYTTSRSAGRYTGRGGSSVRTGSDPAPYPSGSQGQPSVTTGSDYPTYSPGSSQQPSVTTYTTPAPQPSPSTPMPSATPELIAPPPSPPTATPTAVVPPAPTPPPAVEPPAVEPPAPTPSPTPAAAAIDPPAPQSAAPMPPGQPATARPPRASSGLGSEVLHWVLLLVACALLLQIVALALRPLRRWVTLRHLRRPFWTETVDQRVSNSWQLALVGLRDAGWRSSSTEAPREFARRTGVDGVEKCATILERARHGVGIDAEDLAEMSNSADAAYRSARAGLAGTARVASWVRWPLT